MQTVMIGMAILLWLFAIIGLSFLIATAIVEVPGAFREHQSDRWVPVFCGIPMIFVDVFLIAGFLHFILGVA